MDRLDILDLLHKKSAYSDVPREAQEIVELALKGMLRVVGIEPPKYHDVKGLLLEHRDRFEKNVAVRLGEEKNRQAASRLTRELEGG
ncbi:MAG: HEPN domain-containing protein [Thermodesulfobacteriota bacterium]